MELEPTLLPSGSLKVRFLKHTGTCNTKCSYRRCCCVILTASDERRQQRNWIEADPSVVDLISRLLPITRLPSASTHLYHSLYECRAHRSNGSPSWLRSGLDRRRCWCGANPVPVSVPLHAFFPLASIFQCFLFFTYGMISPVSPAIQTLKIMVSKPPGVFQMNADSLSNTNTRGNILLSSYEGFVLR